MIKYYKNLFMYTGPMFSGKTTSLINSYNISKYNTDEKLCFKFSKDRRYDNIIIKNKINTNINSNSNNSNDIGNDDLKNINLNNGNIISHTKKNIPSIYIDKCMGINKFISEKIKEIYIDEGQFFDDIYKWYSIINNSLNNIENIYISGLNYDYKGQIFNNEFDKLLNIKDDKINVYYHTSKCYNCQEKAEYTILLDKSNLNKMDGNVLIADNSVYQPCCKNHINFRINQLFFFLILILFFNNNNLFDKIIHKNIDKFKDLII